MYRVLKFGGRLIILDVYKYDGEWVKEEMYDEWFGFSENEIKEWFESIGFKKIEIEDIKLKVIGVLCKGEYIEIGIFLVMVVK